MKLCRCGHILWLTAGVRACGACDLMGRWPRIKGVDRTGQTSAGNPPYDWATDEGSGL